MLRWPILLRYLSFLAANTFVRYMATARGKEEYDIVHSTGPDVLHPSVTTLHVCAWAVAAQIYMSKQTGYRRFSSARRWHSIASYWMIALFERYVACWGARHVVGVSASLASDVVRFDNIGPRRLTVIPNGVNLSEFFPDAARRALVRGQLGIDETTTVLIFVGFNWERKGVEQLVTALADLRNAQADLDTCLILVGGRGQPAYERAIDAALAGRVRFLGPRRDVADLYRAADLCVLPSQQESFGMPVLEAMACGIPAIVSRRAGVAEIITGGRDGFLLEEPENAAELAIMIQAITRDRSALVRAGEEARRTAERYSWSRIADMTVELYQAVIDERSAQRMAGN